MKRDVNPAKKGFLGVKMDEGDLAKLKELAKEQDKSTALLVKEILWAYLEKVK